MRPGRSSRPRGAGGRRGPRSLDKASGGPAWSARTASAALQGKLCAASCAADRSAPARAWAVSATPVSRWAAASPMVRSSATGVTARSIAAPRSAARARSAAAARCSWLRARPSAAACRVSLSITSSGRLVAASRIMASSSGLSSGRLAARAADCSRSMICRPRCSARSSPSGPVSALPGRRAGDRPPGWRPARCWRRGRNGRVQGRRPERRDGGRTAARFRASRRAGSCRLL
jgi:hypothetical protein